jgi:hypothetical protein
MVILYYRGVTAPHLYYLYQNLSSSLFEKNLKLKPGGKYIINLNFCPPYTFNSIDNFAKQTHIRIAGIMVDNFKASVFHHHTPVFFLLCPAPIIPFSNPTFIAI